MYPVFRFVIRTGWGKRPARTILHSVVRDTPIILRTSLARMNRIVPSGAAHEQVPDHDTSS